MDAQAPEPPYPNSGGVAAIDIHQPFTPAERIQQLGQVDNVRFSSLPSPSPATTRSPTSPQDIASLLNHLSSAIRALATPPSSSSGYNNDGDDNGDVLILDNPADPSAHSSSSDPLESFKTAQASFFQTVDRIDKQLTRQIFALEEAGIITLRGGNGGAGANVASDHQQQQQEQEQAGGQQQQGADGAAGAVAARLEPNGIGRYGKLDVGQLNMASSTVERDFEAELWARAREHVEGMVRDEEDRMKE